MKHLILLSVLLCVISILPLSAQQELTDVEKRKRGIGQPEQNANYIKGLASLSKAGSAGNRIQWKTGSGGGLDSYTYYGDPGDPILFSILIDQDVKTLENVKLTLSVWDVDESQGEVDVVYVNGQFIGTLHGANDSWSINNYSIDPSILVGGTKAHPGVNDLAVDLTVSGWAVTVDWGAISADGGEFNIVEFIPGQNMLTSVKTPDIHFKFSDDIDDKTVGAATVKLQYRIPGGDLTDVACTYAVAKDVLRITPVSQLKDGVKYSIEITGEDDGVKSKSGAQLPSSPSYDFATIPDLTPDGPLANEPGVFPIQVVRNAKQIRDKPVVMRVYTNKWSKWADVDPSSQLESLPVKVTIRDEAKNEIAVEETDAERNDIRDTEANRKAGTNSINIYYDWLASLADGNHTIEAVIEPIDQAAVPPVSFSKSTPITLRAGKTLKVVYQYVLAEEWAGGVPPAELERMDGLMARCKTFFRDNFPVTDVEITKAANIDLAVPLASYTWPQAAHFPALDVNTTKPFRDTVKNILLNLDAWKNKGSGVAFVGLIPPNFGKRSVDSGWVNETSYTGVSYVVGNGAVPENNKLILLRDDGGDAGSGANATTVAHEFGHNYSLSSKNFSGTAHTADLMPTEGFWVTKKINKSSTEGNTEDASQMSLMSVAIKPENQRWICDYDYNELFDNVPSASMRGKTVGTGQHLFIAGGYDMKNQFYLSPVWENEYTTSTYPNQGDLTLILMGPTGTTLATYNFNSFSLMFGDGTTDTVKTFGIFVPTPSGLGKLQIKKGAALLKEIVKSAAVPQVTITSPAAGESWTGNRTISWSGTDADNEKLLYSVAYSNDGGQSWLSLAANYDKTTLGVTTTQLMSGQNCVLRVTATDGTLNFGIKDVVFKVNNGMSIGLFSPANNSTSIGVGTDIEAVFATSVAVSQIGSSVFTVKEYGAGTQVAGTVKYLYASKTLKFVPNVNLKFNTKYVATIAGGVTDEFGNRLAADVVWYFTTGSDNTSLSILSANPGASSTNVPVNGGVTVVFSTAMNNATLTAASFLLSDNVAKTPIAGTITYNAALNSATLSPGAPLKKMHDYKVTLTTDIKSAGGTPLAQPYTYFFITGSDSMAGVHLIGKYSETGMDDNNDKLFDWLAIDVDVNVVDAGTYSVNGKLADKNNNEIVWASAMNQSLNTGLSTIRLKFDGRIINAYKLSGPYYLNDLQIYNAGNTDKSDWISYAYTTKAYTYTDFQTSTIPVVAAFTPIDGATSIPANSAITATFTRPMNPMTIDSNSFYVVDRLNKKVQGTIACDSAARTASYTPASPFMPDSVYRVAMTTRIQDVTGAGLLKQYNWSFTIASRASTAAGSIGSIYTYPNPFPHESLPDGGMYFTYMLDAGGGTVRIRIYSIVGDFIKEIGVHATPAAKGFNQVYWNGKNESGKFLANGTYLYIIYYTDGAGTEHKETGKFTVLHPK